MLAIAMYLIKGEYCADPLAIHWNEATPEWPPSPWAVLRAMALSGLRNTSFGEAEIDALIAQLTTPPNYRLPSVCVADDADASGRRQTADLRFDAGGPGPVIAVWDGVNLYGESLALLESLLRHVQEIGRTPVRCAIVREGDALGETHPNCWYVPPGAALPEQCEYLCIRAALDGARVRDFCVEEGMRFRVRRVDPPASRWVLYARQTSVLSEQPSGHADSCAALAKAAPTVTLAVYAFEGISAPPVEATLRIAELARRAVMAQYGRRTGGGTSSILAGKDSDGRPLKGHKHAFYLPTDEDGDGYLDHLSIYSPEGFGRSELAALMSTRYLNPGNGTAGIWLGLRGLVDADSSTGRLGRLFTASDTWVSATPYVLTRHPKVTRAGAPKMTPLGVQRDGPEDQVIREWEGRRACGASLPRMVSVGRLEDKEYATAGKWVPWDVRRERPGLPIVRMPAVRLRIVFDGEIRGPLALGYGCHFGMGLFTPEQMCLQGLNENL